MAASGAVAAASAVFVVTYHRRARWYRTEAGRHIMSFSAATGFLGAYTVIASIWPGIDLLLDLLRWARTAVILGLAALLVQRTRMVLRAQRPPKQPPQS
jgi:hypothetical protein